MTEKQFFSLGSIAKLAKLTHRSLSTIYRWKREGIPKASRDIVEKIVKKSKPKKTKVKRVRKEPSGIQLTSREKKQQKEQKRLALEERKRLLLIEKEWVTEYLPQPYTEKRVVELYKAIERNKMNLQKIKKPKRIKRIKMAMNIAKRMIMDWLDGAPFINPNLIQPLLEEYSLDEDEAYRDVYGYV